MHIWNHMVVHVENKFTHGTNIIFIGESQIINTLPQCIAFVISMVHIGIIMILCIILNLFVYKNRFCFQKTCWLEMLLEVFKASATHFQTSKMEAKVPQTKLYFEPSKRRPQYLETNSKMETHTIFF